MNELLELSVGFFMFISVFLKCYQIKAVQHNKTLLIGLLSFFIASCWLIVAYFGVTGTWANRTGILIGAPLGAMLSNVVYNRNERKEL